MRRALVAVLASLAITPAAQAATFSSYFDAGEGDHAATYFTPTLIAGPGASVTGDGSDNGRAADLEAHTAGNNDDDRWLTIVGAQTLQPGVFDEAGAGSGNRINWSGCSSSGGRFQVLDYAQNPDNTIARAWIMFEQRCPRRENHYGELRINEPVPDTPATAVPGILRWGAGEPGQVRPELPVTLVASRAGRVTSTSVSGDTASFNVVDSCTNRQLAAGDRCPIYVDYRPDGAGTRIAQLTVNFDDGTSQTVPLQGFTYGGEHAAHAHPRTGRAAHRRAAAQLHAGQQRDAGLRQQGRRGAGPRRPELGRVVGRQSQRPELRRPGPTRTRIGRDPTTARSRS